MKGRIAKLVMFALLAFQLAVGQQLPAAQLPSMAMHANAALMSMPMGAAANEHCPMHSHAADLHTADQRATTERSAVASVSLVRATGYAGAHPHAPASGHDCCRTGACLCHCASSPAALGVPAYANIPAFVAVSTLSSAQIVSTRVDELFRPPIA